MSLLDLLFLLSAVLVGVISFTRELSSANPAEFTASKASPQPQSWDVNLTKRVVHKAHAKNRVQKTHHNLTLNR